MEHCINKATEWNSTPAVIVGNAGEQIILDRLEARGLVVYGNVTEGAAPFDGMAWRYSGKGIPALRYAYDVKTLKRVGKAFTIKTSTLNDYKKIQKRMRCQFRIYFIDHTTGDVYYQTLAQLQKKYTKAWLDETFPTTRRIKGSTTFHAGQMVKVNSLNHEEHLQMNEALCKAGYTTLRAV